MTYYIEDYDYEKHDLLVEEGDKNQQSGSWIDQPQLTFYEDNVIRIGYSISIVKDDIIILTFYNDLMLNAKDGHRLSVEEIAIFMLLLMSETIIDSTDYLKRHHHHVLLTDVPATTPDTIIDFIHSQLDAQN
jgi:hypothetical protein